MRRLYHVLDLCAGNGDAVWVVALGRGSDLYRAERSAVNRGGVPRAGNCVTARSQDHVIK